MREIFLTLAFLLLLGTTVFTQDFPYDIFKPRTLNEVVSLTKKNIGPSDPMFFPKDHLESKVLVTFTGRSKPISAERKTFISIWAEKSGETKTYANLYQREFLYKAGQDEYWLPTQETIIKYFDKELKAGDKMSLYLIRIGARRDSQKNIDCILLVEEFRAEKPTSDNSTMAKPEDTGTKGKTSTETVNTTSDETNEADFDALALKVNGTNAVKDLDNLYRPVFALKEWHFIARGQFPNVRPYIASNPDIANGQPMIRAFTDTDRLYRFARENKLLTNELSGKQEDALVLSIPTDKIIDYLEQFTSKGVYGIWFNSDTESEGFFVPLKQLRPIKQHLEKSNR